MVTGSIWYWIEIWIYFKTVFYYQNILLVLGLISVLNLNVAAATYNWRKQSAGNFKRDPIYTYNNPHIFISNNGRLYFTEATEDDVADYYCEVGSLL